MKKKKIENAKNFEELLTEKYGEKGTPGRDKYEEEYYKFWKKHVEATPGLLRYRLKVIGWGLLIAVATLAALELLLRYLSGVSN